MTTPQLHHRLGHDPLEAAPLHLSAAELRREAGAWDLCIENYAALTRCHLEHKNLKAAAAYVRKLLFVTERSPGSIRRMEACLLAASVHIAFGQAVPASAAAAEAAGIAVRLPDPSGLKIADARFREISVLSASNPGKSLTAECACGEGQSYVACCGVVVTEIPAEFGIRIDGIGPERAPANPWHSLGRSGLDVVMTRHGADGACLDWVSLRAAGGRHSLVTLPNWPARAMRAARTMADVSLADPDGTDGPSSTVLQVAAGIEAFVNAIHFFLSRSERERTAYKGLPRDLFGTGHGGQQSGNAHDRATAMGRSLFGQQWGTYEGHPDPRDAANLLAKLQLLVDLRTALLHYKGDNEEQIVPIPRMEHPKVKAFKFLKDLRSPPLPWIDRVLTPGLARWSVELGENLIFRFQADWHARQCERERSDAPHQDPDDASPFM